MQKPPIYFIAHLGSRPDQVQLHGLVCVLNRAASSAETSSSLWSLPHIFAQWVLHKPHNNVDQVTKKLHPSQVRTYLCTGTSYSCSNFPGSPCIAEGELTTK